MNIKEIQDLAKSYSNVLEKVQVANRKRAQTNLDPVGQADADIDNDGDVDKSDQYLHNRRKKISKAVKGETATMNPKIGADKAVTDEQKESTKMSIRDKLLSVLERNNDHYKSAAEAEPMDNNLKGAGARKMKADIDGNTVTIDLEKQSHDDASKAGRVTKAASANPTDKNSTKGDSKIVKPVVDVTKSVKESFSKTVHSIAAAYSAMYAPKEEDMAEENIEENYRVLATKGMGAEAEKHIKVGTGVDYYHPKTGDKGDGKITKMTATHYHVKDANTKQTHVFKYHDRVAAKKLMGEDKTPVGI